MKQTNTTGNGRQYNAYYIGNNRIRIGVFETLAIDAPYRTFYNNKYIFIGQVSVERLTIRILWFGFALNY